MRYNIYNQVHRPLKLAMLETSIELTKDGLSTTESRAKLVQNVSNVLSLFNQLVRYEYTYILPLVFDFEPSVWNTYTTEHQAAMNLGRKLEDQLSSLKRKRDEAAKASLLAAIRETYQTFMVFNLHHMSDEEEVLNEILWRYYSDNVLVEIEHGMKVLPMLMNKHSFAA